MIKITITSGHWQGRARYFVGNRVVVSFEKSLLGEEIDPSGLFGGFLHHGDTWEIDYSQATSAEMLDWYKPDIAARIMRALAAGRPVRFMDHVWVWRADGPSLEALVCQIENTSADSGFNIMLEADDENGVFVGTAGLE